MFDRFDIITAHYLYCLHHHTGQWSALYRRLCRIQTYFTPGAFQTDDSLMTPEVAAIYDALCERAR